MNFAKIVFWVALTIGTVFHAVTLPYSPAHCQDEVQINEVSRRLYETTDWTMYWLPVEDANSKNINCNLSGIPLQELGYRWFGHVGPRIFPLIALVLLAVLGRFYFFCRVGSEWLSTVFALMLFCFPDLVRSVHDARLESESFLWLFATLSVFHLKSLSNRLCLTLSLAGVFSVCCVHVWPTCPVLLPIVIWEVFDYVRRKQLRVHQFVRPVLVAALVSLLVECAFRIPMFCNYDVYVAVKKSMLAKHLGTHGLQWGMFFRDFFVFPFIYVFGVSCLFCRRHFWIMALGALAFMSICVMTYTYGFRTIYFAPYALIGMAAFLSTLRPGCLRKWFVIIVCGMSFFLYMRSVVVRNVCEYLVRDARDETLLENVLEREIGREVHVYSETLQTYYAGRALGWKQYMAFAQFYEVPDPIPPQLGNKCEYYICESRTLNSKKKAELAQFGFVPYKIIPAQSLHPGKIADFMEKHNRILPYGPYTVYRRSK